MRVVYVEIDPVAVAHSRSMLEGNPNATAIGADVRDPSVILHHPEMLGLLDFEQPVGLLMVSVGHYVVDNEQAFRDNLFLDRPERAFTRAGVAWKR